MSSADPGCSHARDLAASLCQEFGITDVLINLHSHADRVQEFLKDFASGVEVRTVQENSLLGSAGTLRANRAWVAEEDFFWVFYADVLTSLDLGRMAALHMLHQPAATLGVYEVPDPRRCGIVSVGPNGVIDRFVEKPEHPPGNLAFAGLMIGTNRLIDVIPDGIPVDIGFHVLPLLGGQMLAFRISDYLLDIGTMENYHRAQETWPGLSA
jgi:mannose-1-phosphate guanylyltransferase